MYIAFLNKSRHNCNFICILQDFQDAYDLLQAKNVNHEKLLAYAREAANFSTSNQLPNPDFALNHYQKEDVAMFDFTSLYHSEHAAKIYERRGRRLLALVVGDSLLEVQIKKSLSVLIVDIFQNYINVACCFKLQHIMGALVIHPGQIQ